MRSAALPLLALVLVMPAGCAPRKTVEKPAARPVPDIAIEASKLSSLYQSDATAADRAFKGRMLIVSGKVATFGEDSLEYPYVTLETTDSAEGVQCVFTMAQTDTVSNLAPGDRMTTRGRCEGIQDRVVVLRNCALQR